MFARATGARVQTQVPHNFCCFDHFERRQQILRHPLLRTTLSRRPASYACSKEAAGQAGRGAEVLKERTTRNYYHIEIFFFSSNDNLESPDRKLHGPLGKWEQEQVVHIALGEGRRWYHMSGNSGKNVSKIGACAHYVPPFSFISVHANPFTANGLQKYAEKN